MLEAPDSYDEFLRHLKRRGLAVPNECVERDWAEPYQKNEALVSVLREIYERPRGNGMPTKCVKSWWMSRNIPALAVSSHEDG